VSSRRVIAQNRKARHDYLIEETLEAGIVLLGSEVKSLRANNCSIAEAYAAEKDGEFQLINAYIPEYQAGQWSSHEPRRSRKLLLHAREIGRLTGAAGREGMTVVPLSLYFNKRGIAKVELGLARGRKKADKREAEKKKEWRRERAQVMRERG
jgi:SsrA-binding protein